MSESLPAAAHSGRQSKCRICALAERRLRKPRAGMVALKWSMYQSTRSTLSTRATTSHARSSVMGGASGGLIRERVHNALSCSPPDGRRHQWPRRRSVRRRQSSFTAGTLAGCAAACCSTIRSGSTPGGERRGPAGALPGGGSSQTGRRSRDVWRPPCRHRPTGWSRSCGRAGGATRRNWCCCGGRVPCARGQPIDRAFQAA